jgi:hypothetical protein
MDKLKDTFIRAYGSPEMIEQLDKQIESETTIHLVKETKKVKPKLTKLRKPKIKTTKTITKSETIEQIFKSYRSGAVRRGLEFTLDLNFFETHWKASCYYCDTTIDKVSFDRLNNSMGYTTENSVPCCKLCNFMKHVLDYDTFINQCRIIANKHKLNFTE